MMNAVKRLITLCIEEMRSACLPFSLLNAWPNTMLVSGQKAYGLVSYEKLILPVSFEERTLPATHRYQFFAYPTKI